MTATHAAEENRGDAPMTGHPFPGTPTPTGAGGTEARSRPWWLEPAVLVLLALTASFFGIRVTELSVRGEESRRGRIAWEIWQNGDWIVPRIQGEPVFFRPPLQNWLIALMGAAHGRVDESRCGSPASSRSWF